MIIPSNHPIHHTFEQLAQSVKVIVFSGLPGFGKSLYVKEFNRIAEQHQRKVSIIQWDIARKAFETPEISAKYPIKDGMVHNGVKVAAGLWLIETLKQWLLDNTNENELLLIEAPLVGNRFVELAKVQENLSLETFLKSDQIQFVVPIPSVKIRQAIESAREKEVHENAKDWYSAKPSVMLILYKMVCGIANEFGADIDLRGQPPYDPKIVAQVFRRVLQHRHFIALHINDLFNIKFDSDSELHFSDGICADAITANHFGQLVEEQYPDEAIMNQVIDHWYRT